MTAIAFDYRAIDRSGAIRRGVTSAASQGEAYRRLVALGLTPVRLTQAAAGRGLLRTAKVRTRDLAHFTYQLGVLISARIPISEGLLSIAQQEREPSLRVLITDIAKRIESGEQLAGAMNAHRKQLGDIYVETVRAAERSGNLPKVMDILSDMLERQLETTRMVRGALMYPACVVTVLSGATLFLVGFVVPKFAAMFRSKGQQLPEFTEALMFLGTSLRSHWWAYALVVAGIVFGIRTMWRRPRGRQAIDRLLHRIPYLNRILVGLAVSRFCQIFGVSLSSGLGLIESLELAGKASGRPLLAADIAMLISRVRTGGRLTEVLGECAYLTPFTRRMLSAGEQSAELPRMCAVVARHYDRETTHLTKNLGTVIEPVLIVGIALVVLVVALAIFLPMWDMVKLVG